MRILDVRRKFTEGESFPLFFIGDEHLGNANCAKAAIQRDHNVINTYDNAIVIKTGDAGDFIAENDRRYKKEHLDRDIVGMNGSIIDNTVMSVAAFNEDIIDKAIAVIDGNHELVANDKNNGTNVTVRWLHELQANDLYCGSSALIRIMFEDVNGHTSWCGINLHHGKRVAKSKSTLLNAYLQKLDRWPDCHILARGHCHFRGYDSKTRCGVNKTWDSIRDREVFAVLTGGYIKGYMEDGGSHVEDMDLDPLDIGMMQVNLKPSRYGMKIECTSGEVNV